MKDKPLYDCDDDVLIYILRNPKLVKKYTVLCESGDVKDLYFGNNHDQVILYATVYLDAKQVYCEGQLIYKRKEYNPILFFLPDEKLLEILHRIDAK